jgi:hypothetical protein
MRKLIIVLVATAFVLGLCFSAMAQQRLFYMEKERLPVPPAKELEIYGSVRVMTYFADLDKENIGAQTLGVPPTGFDDKDLTWALDDGSSRFGVRFRADKVGANVEIRPREQNRTGYGGSTALLRHWYGTYDLGWGTFLMGQTWTPTFNPICNECLLGGGGFLDGYGDLGGSARKAGLQLHMPVKAINGLLKLALLEPTTQRQTIPGGLASAVQGFPTGALAGGIPTQGLVPAGWTSSDTTIPAIEASLASAFGPLRFTVRGGYNTYDVKNAATDQDESVDSYVLALDVTYSMGPIYVRGSAYMGQNMAAFGSQAPFSNFTHGFSPALYTTAAGTVAVEDVDNFGWFGVVGFKITDMYTIEAGYGQRKSELDEPGVTTWKEKKGAFVLLFPISVTRTFIITPELLWTDEGDFEGNGLKYDRGNRLYYGIYWRIDF